MGYSLARLVNRVVRCRCMFLYSLDLVFHILCKKDYPSVDRETPIAFPKLTVLFICCFVKVIVSNGRYM